MKWIDVKDQLPPIKRIVLCATEDAHYFVGYYNGIVNKGDYTDPQFWDGEEWSMYTEPLNCDNYRNDTFEKVTHWMEIPLVGGNE